ncbi:MAG: discoidin domain-containing protein [Sandaracinaceae bacterium]|nr:discoidin domain-containing protein [Sandaracinaceae bacterium]
MDQRLKPTNPVVEMFWLSAAAATAARISDRDRTRLGRELAVGRQRAEAAEALWSNGHAAEGLRLAGQAYEATLAVVAPFGAALEGRTPEAPPSAAAGDERPAVEGERGEAEAAAASADRAAGEAGADEVSAGGGHASDSDASDSGAADAGEAKADVGSDGPDAGASDADAAEASASDADADASDAGEASASDADGSDADEASAAAASEAAADEASDAAASEAKPATAAATPAVAEATPAAETPEAPAASAPSADLSRVREVLGWRGVSTSRLDELAELDRLLRATALPDWDEDITPKHGELFQRLVAAQRRLDGAIAPGLLTSAEILWSRITRVGGTALVLVAALVGAWLAVRVPPGVNATASGQWSPDYGFAEWAIDGNPNTEWQLPNNQPGWLQITINPATRVERLRVLNGHNRQYNDRAIRHATIELYVDGEIARTIDETWPSISPSPDWNEYEVGLDRVDKIRVVVHSFHQFGAALAEIAWE